MLPILTIQLTLSQCFGMLNVCAKGEKADLQPLLKSVVILMPLN